MIKPALSLSLVFAFLILSFQNCGTGYQAVPNGYENLNSQGENEAIPPEDSGNSSSPPLQEANVVSESSTFEEAYGKLQKKGDWATIDYSLDSEFFRNINGGHDLTWADSAHWDFRTKCIYHYGGGHITIPAMTIYCPLTGQWKHGSLPPWIDWEGSFWGYTNHGYDRNAIDREKSLLYYRRGKVIYTYNMVTEEWSSTAHRYNTTEKKWDYIPVEEQPRMAGSDYLSDYEGSEFFPGLGLIVNAHRGGLYTYNPQSQEYRHLPNAPYYDIGKLHTFYEYSYKHKLMIMGGGNDTTTNYTDVFLLRPDGTGKKTTNSPYSIRTLSSGLAGALLQEDPISGNFVALFYNGQIHEFDPLTETWTHISNSPLEEGQLKGIMGASMPDHGIIMYVKSTGNKSARVYLYKHSD